MTTGQRIKAERRAKGLTQEELGQKLGISGAAIAQYETEKRRPKLETLAKIAKALEIDIRNLDDNLANEVSFESYLFPDLNLPHEKTVFHFYGRKVSETSVVDDGVELKAPIDTPIGHLLYSFTQLNDEGQLKAVERVIELAEIPRYQRKSPSATLSPLPESISNDKEE